MKKQSISKELSKFLGINELRMKINDLEKGAKKNVHEILVGRKNNYFKALNSTKKN